MFLCDAILGNSDRHQGNWGFLECKGRYYVAPIFDNASSLYSQIQLSIHLMKENLKFFRSRVYMLPFSAFKLKDSKKCMKPNYYVLLNNMEGYYGFSKVLVEFQSIGVHSIDKNIKGILDSLELKIFYRDIVLLRYLCLICSKDFDTSYDILTQMGYFSI